MNRRQALATLAVVIARPGLAAEGDLATAIRDWTQGAPVKEGRVKLDVAELIDNGNAVPATVTVQSPMTDADHVTAVALFNEKNPQRDIARFTLTPRMGKAEVATRIRLATSQKLVAVARMKDGTHWSHTIEVIVTLAACIEDPS